MKACKQNSFQNTRAQVGLFSSTVFKKASGKPFFKFILAKRKQTTALISIVAYSLAVLATAFEDKVRKKFFNFIWENIRSLWKGF